MKIIEIDGISFEIDFSHEARARGEVVYTTIMDYYGEFVEPPHLTHTNNGFKDIAIYDVPFFGKLAVDYREEKVYKIKYQGGWCNGWC